jgi:uncharacterized membrane protein (UPF0127 family)
LNPGPTPYHGVALPLSYSGGGVSVSSDPAQGQTWLRNGLGDDSSVLRAILSVTMLGAFVACSDFTSPTPGSGHLVGVATFSGSHGEVRTDPLGVADSDEERANGLMGTTSLPPNGGMVFVFPSPTNAAFWMKDTAIPLSIAFWGADGRIIEILEMTPCDTDPCPTYGPDEPYTDALEMNAHWFERHGIQIGDSVELQLRSE